LPVWRSVAFPGRGPPNITALGSTISRGQRLAITERLGTVSANTRGGEGYRLRTDTSPDSPFYMLPPSSKALR